MNHFYAPPEEPAAESDIPSFCEQIRAAAGPEGLPPGFSLRRLPADGEEPRLRFADGARDGIAMYHTSIEPGDSGPLHEILGLISAGALAAGEGLETFFVPNGPTMLPLIDGLQSWLMGHREEIDPEMLYRFSVKTLAESRNPEAVKFALSMLELLQPTQESRELVSTLALSDEFTLFCLYVIRGWEDGNEELFRLARLVHGWGRIFLVHELEATTPEIRRWLLMEGWNNHILSAYSACRCAQRGGLDTLLAQETLTPEEFAAASGLVAALLDEGPVRNISAMEDGKALLEAYLLHAGKMPQTEEERQTVEAVQRYVTAKS